MSLLLYLMVLLISASGAIFGLGWVLAPARPYKATTAQITNPLPKPPVAVSITSPRCNIQACTVAYHSFRASDCTYQPYHGRRRICTKGMPPEQQQQIPIRARIGPFDTEALAARAEASSCNVAACQAAYKSFDPTDCTYQPYEGLRQLCNK